MKKIHMLIVLFAVITAASAAKAEEYSVDFDRGTFGVADFKAAVETNDVCQNDKLACGLPVPAPVREGTVAENVDAELDYSIMNSLKYSEKSNTEGFITNNLKKLLVYGSRTEKMEFMSSPGYIFPQRFVKFDGVGLYGPAERLKTKRPETHCWEDNCRMERVCDRKEVCENVLTAVCTAVEIGGIVAANPAVAIGGVVCSNVLTKTCKWLDDCADVRKCDSHCETINVNNGTDVVTNGNVIYQ